jgi:hypothetical protein
MCLEPRSARRVNGAALTGCNRILGLRGEMICSSLPLESPLWQGENERGSRRRVQNVGETPLRGEVA